MRFTIADSSLPRARSLVGRACDAYVPLSAGARQRRPPIDCPALRGHPAFIECRPRPGESVANWRLMPLLATDWPTISSLVTGGGTLVLAVATFGAVRSANRSARIAETALQEQRRPLLTQSRLEDPLQKLMFVDEHWVSAAGGRAAAEHIDGSVYLAISLRNVGSGIGVCQGWTVTTGVSTSQTMPTPSALEEFRLQTRDLYVPAGDIGMWQGALRNPDDPLRASTAEAIDARLPITIELLYTDQVGLQRTITRFAIFPTADSWLASVTRHWYLDWDGPRPQQQVRAAVDVVLRDREAAEQRAAGLPGPAVGADGEGTVGSVVAATELEGRDATA
jgi:hypothetical protein